MSSPQRHSRAKTANSGTPAKTPQHEQASGAPFAGLFETMNARVAELTTNPHEIAQQSRTQSLASAVAAVSYKSVLDVPGNWSIGAVNTESLSLGKDGALIIDNVSGVITMNKELDINGDFLVFAPQQIRLETGVSGRAAAVIQDPAFPIWDTSPTSTAIPPGCAGLFAAALNGANVSYAAIAAIKDGNIAMAALDTSGVHGAVTIQGQKIVLAGIIPTLLADVKVNGAALLQPAYSEFFANDGDNVAAITPGDAIAFPQESVVSQIVRAGALLDSVVSFVLPEIGLYDVSWKLHVKQSATPAGTASVCIYVDAGGIAGTTGTSPTSDVTTPGAVIRTGSTVPIPGPNPVELVGRAFIRTLSTNTAISIRNSDASAEFECGAAGACDNLIIRRIDYTL